MTLHLRGCWYAPRPKRSDVRVSKRKQEEVKRDLQSSVPIPDKHKRHIETAAQYRQTGDASC